MIASIAVHVGPDPDCTHRVRAAARLAHRLNGQLFGIYADPSDADESSPNAKACEGGEPASAVGPIAAAQGLFETEAALSGVTAHFRNTPGTAIEALTRQARYCDLLVVSRTSLVSPEADGADDMIAALVLAAGRPVIVLPGGTGEIRSIGKRVLVCWDHGREAARALADAGPIIRNTKELIVLMVQPASASGKSNKAHCRSLISYCRARGYPAPQIKLHCKSGSSLAACLSAAAGDYGCDLIVMGAYGHFRERRATLGGTTRAMSETAHIPVLLSH